MKTLLNSTNLQVMCVCTFYPDYGEDSYHFSITKDHAMEVRGPMKKSAED